MQRVDDAFPGLYDRSDCNPPKDTHPLRPPTDWAPDRNPGFPMAPGRDYNCGDCSRASELTWRGVDTEAGALADPLARGEPVDVMETWSDGDRVPASFDAVGQQLMSLGHGSSAVVGGYWNHGGGHWFNAFNDNGVVMASDGQTGASEPWPPSKAGLGFEEARFKTTFAIFVGPDGKHLTADLSEDG